MKRYQIVAILAIVACLQAGAEPVNPDYSNFEFTDVLMKRLQKTPLTDSLLRSLFEDMDSDGDGFLSQEEIIQHATKTRHWHAPKRVGSDEGGILKLMDTDLDGYVSEDELLTQVRKVETFETDEAEAATLKTESGKFKAADANEDGLLSEHELASLAFPGTNNGVLSIIVQEYVDQNDEDGDGVINQEEWKALEFKKFKEVGFESDLSEAESAFIEDFIALDKDKSGALDFSELMYWESGMFDMDRVVGQIFRAADANDDGSLTQTELTAARGKLEGGEAQMFINHWATDEDSEL